MKKVKWTEQLSASQAMMIADSYPEANFHDFDKKYEGEVIGTNRSLLGTSYLVVACTDNKVREVEISKVTIIE